MNLNSIQDRNVRAYIQSEQNRILVEISKQQQAQQPSQAATSFGQYFNNLSGSENGLSDYQVLVYNVLSFFLFSLMFIKSFSFYTIYVIVFHLKY